MNSKKPSKLTKKNKDWQKEVEKHTKAEKVELDHPKGRERFERIIRKIRKERP